MRWRLQGVWCCLPPTTCLKSSALPDGLCDDAGKAKSLMVLRTSGRDVGAGPLRVPSSPGLQLLVNVDHLFSTHRGSAEHLESSFASGVSGIVRHTGGGMRCLYRLCIFITQCATFGVNMKRLGAAISIIKDGGVMASLFTRFR